MRIAYVTTYDARNPHAWSGLGYFIWRALANAGAVVELVGPLEVRCPPQLIAKRLVQRYVIGKQYLWERAPRGAEVFAGEAERLLGAIDYDVVLAPDTVPVAYLTSDRPIVTWTDATFASMLGFYPALTPESIARESIEDGLRLDARAIRRSRLAVYGSDWAARSAIEDLDADPSKVKVVPFGANLEEPPSERDVLTAIDGRRSSKCRLLFLGSDWDRKGGATAVAVATELRAAGLDTELTVVGSDPWIAAADREFVNVLGYIDRSNGGESQIRELLAQSHFLILPTHAECYGLPVCEASAFGVPALATSVGGVPTILRDGVNGVLFAPDAAAADYAAVVIRNLNDWASYRELAVESYREYTRRLNWSTAAERMTSLLAAL